MSRKTHLPEPPGWASRLLAALLPWQYRDEHLGDLHEAFFRRVALGRGARRWYVWQVIRSLPAALRLRYQTRNDNPSGNGMESFRQDLRFGIRALLKSPGFAVVSTLTLALAIGVNTSIFSLVSAIVFADLPMRDPGTVALIRATNADLDIDQGNVSPADYFDLVERSRSFESLSALTESQWVLTGGEAPMRLEGLQFTAGLTKTWHLPPVLGRGFAEGEDREGAPPVAMITYGYWQDRYGGRPDVLGKTIRLGGVEHTIIGVTDPRLEFASFGRAKVITPLILNHAAPNRSARYLLVVGRLAPGVTQDAATAEVDRIGADLAREHPVENTGWRLWSKPVRDALLDKDANTILLFLQLTVGMVILIACANVANMLLARATARAREFAVRSALGAGRRRLVRQLLTESLMISAGAAALGLGFAYALNRALVLISAGQEPAFMMARLDGRVLAFTLLVSLIAPLAFGLLPALRASAGGPGAALRDGRSGDGGRAGKHARATLVTLQVALALTLMVVASLLTRTVINLQTRPLGIEAEDLLTVRIDLPEADYESAESRRIFFDQVRTATASAVSADRIELVSALPGVDGGRRRSFVVEGREVAEGRAQPTALLVTVSTGYFDYVGIRVEEGRGFAESDDATSVPVALVSRALADRYWLGSSPVGQRIQVSGREASIEIVGVVSDVRNLADTKQGAPNIYLPFTQDAGLGMYLVARTATSSGRVAGAVRTAIRGVDPDQPVDAIITLKRAIYENGAANNALLTLFVTFAAFALIMAAIGIYGVMSYAVSQRRSEIGLRIALGAERSNVGRMIVFQGAQLLGWGIAIGLLASFALTRLLAGLVFGVSTVDPLTFIGVPSVLILVALVANLVPARRAMTLDPAATLRAE